MTLTAPAAPPALPNFDAMPFAGMFTPPEQVGDPKSIIIYGDPGTRKTTIMGSAIKVRDAFGNPKFRTGIIVDIDNGTEVFATDPEIYAAVLDGRIRIIKIDKTDPNAYGMAKYTLDTLLSQDWGVDFIGLDSLDVLQEVEIKHHMANFVNEKGKLDPRGAWGEISKEVADWMWGFQNSPHFVGITVMHAKDNVEETGGLKIKPKLSGSIKDSIAGIPSMVVYVEYKKLEDGKSHLVATLGKSEVMTTKNRYRIDEELVDFDLPLLYNRIAADRAVPTAQAAPPALPAFHIPAPVATAA